jgi:SAM-dependent methyltransferase
MFDGSKDQTSPCGYCGRKESIRLYPTYTLSGDSFHINRCLSCGCAFLVPRPSPRQLRQVYDDSYYGQGTGKFSSSIEKVLDCFRSARARTVNRYITGPANILDIGCGNGKFLEYVIKRGFTGFGIELPGKAAERAGRIPGLKLKVGPLQDNDFQENFFDCVCMWHVFEHLTEPKQTLRIISEILKPGGYLMMSMPNIDSLQSRLFRGKWLHLDPPRHLFLFGPNKLIEQMKEHQFEPVKRSLLSLEENVFGIQQSILNCLLGKREVLFESLKGNKEYVKQYSGLSIAIQKFFMFGTYGIFALAAGLEAAVGRGGTMQMIFVNRKQN